VGSHKFFLCLGARNPELFLGCRFLICGALGSLNRVILARFPIRTRSRIVLLALRLSGDVKCFVAPRADFSYSALVTNQRGELLGTVSSNEMNRKVGGLGHDPKTEPVEAQVEKNNVYCFEDQTVAEAEQIMCDANVAEVPVVTREKLLVGTTNLEAIAQDKRRRRP
jgi:CBS domain-containing protein